MSKNIKNLILTNFQQWNKGNIQFTKGLNILVGDTECGKSTLFRAISSILTGKMPEDYIRKGCKDVEVKINFDNNTYFRRLRNKKDNIADANGIIFERVGKDIPFEYFKSLGNTSINFGNKDLNLCLYNQFDPHFFITLSDYDKSKLIGTICGIDIVDKLVDSINKDIRNDNSKIKFLKEQTDSKKKELEVKNNTLLPLIKKIENLKYIKNTLETNYKILVTLQNLKNKRVLIDNDINIYQSKQIRNNTILSNFKGLNIKLLEKLLKLKLNLVKYNKEEYELNTIQNRNSKLKEIKFPKNLEILINLRKKLLTYKEEINDKENLFKTKNILINNLKQEKQNLLKEFDKCPLCGGIINE